VRLALGLTSGVLAGVTSAGLMRVFLLDELVTLDLAGVWIVIVSVLAACGILAVWAALGRGTRPLVGAFVGRSCRASISR
jgi:hypothetical protein